VKTVGFYDRGDPRGIIYEYVPESIPRTKQNTLPAHVRRRIAGLQALEGTGNITIILISGRKFRPIARHGL